MTLREAARYRAHAPGPSRARPGRPRTARPDFPGHQGPDPPTPDRSACRARRSAGTPRVDPPIPPACTDNPGKRASLPPLRPALTRSGRPSYASAVMLVRLGAEYPDEPGISRKWRHPVTASMPTASDPSETGGEKQAAERTPRRLRRSGRHGWIRIRRRPRGAPPPGAARRPRRRARTGRSRRRHPGGRADSRS